MTEMRNGTVTVTIDEPGIATILLNRPERLNALNFELVADLHDALDLVGGDDTLKVVILTGAGRGFCAGMDLKDYGHVPDVGAHPHRPVGVDAQTFMSNLTVHLRETPQVVVAAVNGHAFGGGLALACAADIRIAARSARFCSAFIRTGLSATDIGITYLLPQLVGVSAATDLILTGRDIDADEAKAMGLVSRVVDDGTAVDEAMATARGMCRYTTIGLLSTKDVLRYNANATSLQAALALEIRNQNLMHHHPEVRDYMAAYRQATTGTKGA